MDDRDLQAPWVGLCEEDYRRREREEIGYCENCGIQLYENDDFYDIGDGVVCKRCHHLFEDEEE